VLPQPVSQSVTLGHSHSLSQVEKYSLTDTVTDWPNHSVNHKLTTIVGQVKNARVFVAVCGQTNVLSQFKVDSICLPMFPHCHDCGSFSIGPCRPLPYAKLSGTNPELDTCRGNFSINRLLVEPLITRPLADSYGNSCLMTVAYSIISRIQHAMSFFVRSLEPPEGLYLRYLTARPKILHGKCLSSG